MRGWHKGEKFRSVPPGRRCRYILDHESVDTARIYTTPSGQDLQRDVEKVAMV